MSEELKQNPASTKLKIRTCDSLKNKLENVTGCHKLVTSLFHLRLI